MKKIIIALFTLSLTALTVNAQTFVGGGMGLNYGSGQNSNDSGYEYSSSSFGFNITPMVGYFLNDNMSIGVQVSLGNSWSKYKATYPDANNSEQKQIQSRWGFNIFGRYKLLGLGIENLSLLAHGTIGVSGGNYKRIEDAITTKQPGGTSYGINAYPVLSYKLSDKLDILASCDFLTFGYRFSTVKQPDNNLKSTNHNFDLGFNSFSGLNIGFIRKF